MQHAAERWVLPRFVAPQTAGIRHKAGGDLVTLADEQTQAFLAAELPRVDSLPVVGEEGFGAADRKVLQQGDCWIVDPLDGTAPFVAGDPRFAMIVARVRGGRILQGWLLFPAQGEGEMYFAQAGAGAWCNQHRLAVHPNAAPGRMRLSMLHPEDQMGCQAALSRAGFVPDTPTCWEFRRLLHAELGAYVCSHVTPWDMAAGVLLVREAGGDVVRADGAPVSPADEAGIYVFAPSAPVAHQWIDAGGLAHARVRSPIYSEAP